MKKLRTCLFPLIAALLLGSCVMDIPEGPVGGNGELRIYMRLPFAGASTKAMVQGDDLGVEEVTVFVFEMDDSDLKYTYTADVKSVSMTNGEGIVSVRCKPSDKEQIMLVIANASQAAKAYDPQVGESYFTIMNNMKMSLSERWPAGLDGGSVRAIPMTAIVFGIDYNSESETLQVGSAEEPFYFVRMLARLDVSVNENIRSEYSLHDIHLYRPAKSGYVVYNPEYLSDPNVYFDIEHFLQAHAPSYTIPANYVSDKYVYNVPDGQKYAYRNSIFAFESAGTGKHITNTALVVGLRKPTDVQSRYFRIDIKNKPDGTKVADYTADIIRNFIYDITINSVSNEGAEDPGTAYAGELYTLDASVEMWSTAPVNVVFDGQYSLKLDKKRMQFFAEGGSPVLNIKTDDPRGIQISTVTDYHSGPWPLTEWLTVTADGTDESTERNVTITATPIAANDYSSGHSASFVITSGNMNYTFRVTQSRESWLTYRALGAFADGGEYEIKLSSALEWNASIVAGNDLDGTPAITSLLTTNGGPGSGNTTYTETWANYDYTYGVSTPDYTFEKLRFTTYDDLSNVITGGSPAKTSAVAKFRIEPVYDETVYYVEAKDINVLVASCDVVGEANSYVIDAAAKDGDSAFARGILIPASRANNSRLASEPTITSAVLPQITPSGFDVEMLWSDFHYGLDVRGVVSNIKAIPGVWNGVDNSGYVAVLPGLAEPAHPAKVGNWHNYVYALHNFPGGNCAIAAKADGQIKWSWHIWVVEGKGENTAANILAGTSASGNSWMDRNLGSQVNGYDSRYEVQVIGLRYQFGRKDPFARASTLSGSSMSAYVFTSNGAVAKYGQYDESYPSSEETAVTALETMRNPLTFYSMYEWQYNDDCAWKDPSAAIGSKSKSIFDPCPRGWRIPELGELTDDGQWSEDAYGLKNDAFGGYYPKNGYMPTLGGYIDGSANAGYYWFSTPHTDNSAEGYGSGLYIHTRDGYPAVSDGGSNWRSHGISIRCTKDTIGEP